MAIEKKWLAVPPRLMTADGTTEGVITVTSTKDLRVKMEIVLQAPLIPPTRLQLKRVLSSTQIIVGPFPDTNTQGKAGLRTTSDVSVYTVLAGSFIYTAEQNKSIPKSDDIDQAVYEQEPVVAIRTFAVDDLGNSYNSLNPLPVTPSLFSMGILSIPELVRQCMASMNYNSVQSTTVGNVETIIFNLDGNLVHIIEITKTADGWSFVCSEGGVDNLLLEDGFSYLLEDNSLILLE